MYGPRSILARENSIAVSRARLLVTEETVHILIADERTTFHLAETVLYDADLGYESLLCVGKDNMESWLSSPLLEVSEAAGKSRTVGKQLYSGNGNKDGEEVGGVRFMLLGQAVTRATLPMSPKILPGETYAESL